MLRYGTVVFRMSETVLTFHIFWKLTSA